MLIAIPALAKHKPIVRETVGRFLRSGLSPSKIYVVTPDVDAYSFESANQYSVIHESMIERIGKADLVKRLGGRSSRAGWYYQQLLKYAIVEYFSSEIDVLICDADTVIIDDLSGLKNGFPAAREWNQSYFYGLKMLTGLSPVLQKSAIVNFMLFDARYMRSLLSEIEFRSGKSWTDAIIDLLAGNQQFDFSEYEVYANWEASVGGRACSSPYRMFRRADLLLSDEGQLSDVIRRCSEAGFQAVAFEFEHHRSYLKIMFARLLLLLGASVW